MSGVEWTAVPSTSITTLSWPTESVNPMKNIETIFDLALISPCGNVLRTEKILAYLDNCLPMTKNQSVIPTACVVLAAGQGNRMESDLPKVLHPLAGRPMIGHILASVER